MLRNPDVRPLDLLSRSTYPLPLMDSRKEDIRSKDLNPHRDNLLRENLLDKMNHPDQMPQLPHPTHATVTVTLSSLPHPTGARHGLSSQAGAPATHVWRPY